MKSPLRETLTRRLGAVLGMALAVVACTTSENDMGSVMTGAAGTSSSGAAGTSSSGAAGTSSSGAAGTKVDAGAPGGSGSAGTSGGSAGTTGSGAAGTIGGAGTTGTTGAGGTAAQQWVYSGVGGIENVLINSCGGCHFMATGVTIQGGFSFSYANVTGVVTSGNKACPNLDASKRRVVPGKPENSLLYVKISMDKPPAGCGGHMPYEKQSVSAQTLGWIRDWILQGAKP